MAQRKSERIVINIEPSIAAAFRKMLSSLEEEVGPSEYGRGLIVKDLRDRGLMTDKMLVDITT